MFQSSKSLRFQFLYLLITYLCLSSIQSSATNSNLTRYDTVYLNQNQSFNATLFLDDLITSLVNEAQYEDDRLLGWIHEYNSKHQPDTLFLGGYQTGTAGIGDFLLDAYQFGFTELSAIINDTITLFATQYVNDGNNGIYWDRYTNLVSGGWLGNRYGSAGIIKYLARLHSENYPGNLDDVISEAFSWVLNQKGIEGSLPIEPGGYISTGYEYGAGGVGSSFLAVEQFMGNSTYGVFAEDIADWLINVGNWENNQFRIPWTPYGEDTEFDAFYPTGYGLGSAGFIELFLDLYDYSNNGTYKDIAIGLVNDLLVNDQGGFWNDGSLAYISTLYGGNDALIGYYVGASGIVKQLLRAYTYSDDSRLIDSGAQSERFIEAYVHENGSISIGRDYLEVHRTGLGVGAAGVANYYLDLYETFGIERHLESSEKILSHLYDTFKKFGLIPINEANTDWGYSFNIDTGLAGIGKVLLHYLDVIENKDQPRTLLNSISLYEDVYSTTTANTEIPSHSKSNHDDSPILTVNQISYFFIGILVLQYVRKKK